MRYDRLIIEPSDDGWVRFTCPDRLWSWDSAIDSLELPAGFSVPQILEALVSTGWVRESEGQWSLQSSKSVRDMVQLLDDMLSYFYGPNEPSPDLLQIKFQIDTHLNDDLDLLGSHTFSIWNYARLDLLLREKLAEAARTLDAIWEQDAGKIDLRCIREKVIHDFCGDIQAKSDLSGGRMASSARLPSKAIIRERNVG